jgi:hypothetical protein
MFAIIRRRMLSFSVSVILFGCEIWSLTLREKSRLRVFLNKLLKRIFLPKTENVTGEWIKLHNQELNNLYPSPNIVKLIKSRKMRRTVNVARNGS